LWGCMKETPRRQTARFVIRGGVYKAKSDWNLRGRKELNSTILPSANLGPEKCAEAPTSRVIGVQAPSVRTLPNRHEGVREIDQKQNY